MVVSSVIYTNYVVKLKLNFFTLVLIKNYKIHNKFCENTLQAIC